MKEVNFQQDFYLSFCVKKKWGMNLSEAFILKFEFK